MSKNSPGKVLNIDVVSDVMCPWCLIGKRNLDSAISQLPDVKIDVRWRPFQLDPTLPKKGKDRQQYLSDKFRGKEAAKEVYQNIVEAGKNVGIPFDFDAIKVAPNTLDAHRLIHWASNAGSQVQSSLVERLFVIFFLEGGNIGDHKVLIEAAVAQGMDETIVGDLLASDRDMEAVENEVNIARKMGISGVPCFIIENQTAVMGAQPAENLVAAFRDAVEIKQTSANGLASN